ncbi:MAG: hypothetical protein ACRCYY_02120 [Trueperaceae bacterium]
MRGFLFFVIFLVAVFFGVGELRGWTVGIPSQMPLLIYKSDSWLGATRRTVNRQDFPFTVSGKVNAGKVRVEGYYELSASFQSGKAGKPEKLVFEQEFNAGETINIHETLKKGQGQYRIRILFEKATGVFRVNVPKGIDL